jgi:hypothetical protein
VLKSWPDSLPGILFSGSMSWSAELSETEPNRVIFWRVREICQLTDMEREKLLTSLASVEGAVKEHSAWWIFETPPCPAAKGAEYAAILFRIIHLFRSMPKPKFIRSWPPEVWYDSECYLADNALKIYDGKMPPGMSGRTASERHNVFFTLYKDSLLLEKVAVFKSLQKLGFPVGNYEKNFMRGHNFSFAGGVLSGPQPQQPAAEPSKSDVEQSPKKTVTIHTKGLKGKTPQAVFDALDGPSHRGDY